jgi:hypothetical protein
MRGVGADVDCWSSSGMRSGRAGVVRVVRVLTAAVLLGVALLIVAVVGQGIAGARGLTVAPVAPGAAASGGAPPAFRPDGGGPSADGATGEPASSGNGGGAPAEYVRSREAAAMLLAQEQLLRPWGGPGAAATAAEALPEGPRGPGRPGTGGSAVVPRLGEAWRPELARRPVVAEAATPTGPTPPKSAAGILEPVVAAANDLARLTTKFEPASEKARPVVASIQAHADAAWWYETWLGSWFKSRADVHAEAQAAIDELVGLSGYLGGYADRMASDLGRDGEIVRAAVADAQTLARYSSMTVRVPLGLGGSLPYHDIPKAMEEEAYKLYGLVMAYTRDRDITGLPLKVSDDAATARMYAGADTPGAQNAAQNATEAAIAHLDRLATAVSRFASRFAEGLGEDREQLRAAAGAATDAAGKAAAQLMRRIGGEPLVPDGEDGQPAAPQQGGLLLEDSETSPDAPADRHAGTGGREQAGLGAGSDQPAVEPVAGGTGPGPAPAEQHATPDTPGVPGTGSDPFDNGVLVGGSDAALDGGVPSSPGIATTPVGDSVAAVDLADAAAPDGDPGSPSFESETFANVG